MFALLPAAVIGKLYKSVRGLCVEGLSGYFDKLYDGLYSQNRKYVVESVRKL